MGGMKTGVGSRYRAGWSVGSNWIVSKDSTARGRVSPHPGASQAPHKASQRLPSPALPKCDNRLTPALPAPRTLANWGRWRT